LQLNKVQEYYSKNGKYKDNLKEFQELNIGICESALNHYFNENELNEELLLEIDQRIEKQLLKFDKGNLIK